MSENPKILFTPSLSELNETIIPKLKEMISKLDKDLIQSISKTMSKLKQTDKNNPPTLQFDSLQSEPIQQYISNNQKNFNSNNDINAITSHCLILFNIIKMLFRLMNISVSIYDSSHKCNTSLFVRMNYK